MPCLVAGGRPHHRFGRLPLAAHAGRDLSSAGLLCRLPGLPQPRKEGCMLPGSRLCTGRPIAVSLLSVSVIIFSWEGSPDVNVLCAYVRRHGLLARCRLGCVLGRRGVAWVLRSRMHRLSESSAAAFADADNSYIHWRSLSLFEVLLQPLDIYFSRVKARSALSDR